MGKVALKTAGDNGAGDAIIVQFLGIIDLVPAGNAACMDVPDVGAIFMYGAADVALPDFIPYIRVVLLIEFSQPCRPSNANSTACSSDMTLPSAKAASKAVWPISARACAVSCS